MSMYCRITGKSRGLPKPNYFPLLPPISPADAKKLCRITGKTHGLPTSHQYIPIPLIAKQRSPQICPVTGKSIGQAQHHFIPELPGKSAEIRHLPVAGYRYVVPVLDPPPPALQDLLAQDVQPDNVAAQYVYTLDEKSCGLVVPANIEAAVRQGTVASILLADNKEKLSMKLIEGTQIVIRVQEMPVQPTIDMQIPENWLPLLDGQGPTAKAVQIVEKKKKKAALKAKKKEAEMELMKKVFVEKEQKAEIDELQSIVEKKAKEEAKIKTPEPLPELNGILKHPEPEVTAPKVAKKVMITGDEKIKVLHAIKEIYMSNGDGLYEDEDISEIEDIKSSPSAAKQTLSELSTISNGVHAKQGVNHSEMQAEELMLASPLTAGAAANVRPATAAAATAQEEKHLKQAKNEQIKTLESKLNGEITKEITGVTSDLTTTTLSQQATAARVSLAPGTINTPASREIVQLSDGQTIPLNTALPVTMNAVNNTESPHINGVCENNTVHQTINGTQGILEHHMTSQHEKLKGSLVSGNQQKSHINGELIYANGIQENGISDEVGPLLDNKLTHESANILQEYDGTEKSKVLTALQQIHKGKPNTETTDNNVILAAGKSTSKKSKSDKSEPCKQLYKSNGTSVQLIMEPWNEVTKRDITPDEHVTPLPELITIPPPTYVNVADCEPGVIQQQPSGLMLRTSVSLPPAPATCANQPPRTPDTSVLKCVWEVAKQDQEVLEKTANAVQVLQPKHADKVATLQDILKLTKNLEKGTETTIKWGDDILHGRNVYINRDKSCFVPGLKVNGNFIPGQTIDNEFVAGLTVKTVTKIGLIPGCVMKDGGFVAGMSKEGKFISGQIFNTGEKEEFVPGQTIMTPDGPRFVPGQITDEQFVPGLIVNTSEGPQFIQGQSPEPGEFRPGKVCYKVETGEKVFVPGQTVTENGEHKFIPGRTLATPQGPQFVPGREVTDGKHIFVPGISEESTFIPGAVIDTPSGEQFVEGRILMSQNGKTRFVPGTSENNQFVAVKNEAELKTHPTPEHKVPYLQDVSHSTVYGHMIQKTNDVQFYPEGSILPTKGVTRSIPGQLVKYLDDDEEPSFVPGMMVDGKFVAGQMVRTVDGTKFVPGQLVKNKTGAKFVPGQTLDDGQFVPGQVVADKFVPGQIVQTAAGPTFIPGQVISTPEEGARFVPGRVVETSRGPHFVPGRVIEDGNGGVAFAPGRVVETGDGPRFVAPDLESAPDGTVQFSMQSFEVSPEELQLIEQQSYRDEVGNIDSTMLHQLARAGISIAQKTLPDVYICPVKNIQEIATHITERLKLPEEAHAKMTTILQKAAELGHVIKTCDVKSTRKPSLTSQIQKQAYELIESAVTAAMMTANKDMSLNPGEAIVQEIGHLLQDTLHQLGNTANADFLLNAMYEIVSSQATLEAITVSVQKGLKQPVANKVEVLKDILNKPESVQDTVAKISTVLRKPNRHLDIGKAFKRLSVGDPELVDLVVSKVGEKVDKVSTEKQATNTLQNSIVSAVRECSEKQILDILDHSDISGLKHLILQAVGLARALGLDEAAEELTVLLEDTRIATALSKDRTALEILQRLTLMKKLSESRPAHAQALGNLSSSTRKEDARYLKQLVRESEALLTSVLEEDDSFASEDEDYSYTNSSFNSTFDDEIISRVPTRIKSSHDIPAALFHALVDCQKPAQLLHKLLSALGEDRLYSYDHACVILKNNIQAVIPKESSRSVLTGKASYTLIDEKGVRQFGAMDVFSALKISKPIALRRFSVYTTGLESTWGYATELPPVNEDDTYTEPITDDLQDDSEPEESLSEAPPPNLAAKVNTNSSLVNKLPFLPKRGAHMATRRVSEGGLAKFNVGTDSTGDQKHAHVSSRRVSEGGLAKFGVAADSTGEHNKLMASDSNINKLGESSMQTPSNTQNIDTNEGSKPTEFLTGPEAEPQSMLAKLWKKYKGSPLKLRTYLMPPIYDSDELENSDTRQSEIMSNTPAIKTSKVSQETGDKLVAKQSVESQVDKQQQSLNLNLNKEAHSSTEVTTLTLQNEAITKSDSVTVEHETTQNIHSTDIPDVTPQNAVIVEVPVVITQKAVVTEMPTVNTQNAVTAKVAALPMEKRVATESAAVVTEALQPAAKNTVDTKVASLSMQKPVDSNVTVLSKQNSKVTEITPNIAVNNAPTLAKKHAKTAKETTVTDQPTVTKEHTVVSKVPALATKNPVMKKEAPKPTQNIIADKPGVTMQNTVVPEKSAATKSHLTANETVPLKLSSDVPVVTTKNPVNVAPKQNVVAPEVSTQQPLAGVLTDPVTIDLNVTNVTPIVNNEPPNTPTSEQKPKGAVSRTKVKKGTATDKTSVHPEKTSVHPAKTFAQSEKPSADPENNSAHHEKPSAHPDKSVVSSCKENGVVNDVLVTNVSRQP